MRDCRKAYYKGTVRVRNLPRSPGFQGWIRLTIKECDRKYWKML